jgi:transposase-like protein
MKCPKCGQEMDLEEKDTSSGRDMRTYICRPCKERVDVDNGVALWKVLHDAREEMEEKRRRAGTS